MIIDMIWELTKAKWYQNLLFKRRKKETSLFKINLGKTRYKGKEFDVG